MNPVSENFSACASSTLPTWFRQKLPDMPKIRGMQAMFREARLHTVCESAHCPNMGQCWGRGVATFMILGGTCTRACRFCAVPAGQPMTVDASEPEHVAEAVRMLKLRYVVVTSVARDDLADEGAEHFSKTIQAIRRISPDTKIEILIPDFSGRAECLQTVVDAHPEVISHNIETVERLSPDVRPQAGYRRSLETLTTLKRMDPSIFIKSSLMVGLGETWEEVLKTLSDLKETGCEILTIGQYLSPSEMKRHLKVVRYWHPKEFEDVRDEGYKIGFKHVMAGPLVRSSYIAEEGYNECLQMFQGEPR